jgi:hypothetical protein
VNQNHVITDRWSNEESRRLYEQRWPGEGKVLRQYENGNQCGGCSFFAPFNSDWGLCCHAKSRHHLETVFEHFTCESFVNEGWDAHSFREVSIDELFGGDPHIET